MSDNILKDLFEIREDKTYEFKEICGLTFAFMTRTTIIQEKISAYEIKPVGIIYKENDEYSIQYDDEKKQFIIEYPFYIYILA